MSEAVVSHILFKFLAVYGGSTSLWSVTPEARRGSLSAFTEVKQILFLKGDLTFQISYFPLIKMGLILFLFSQKLPACYCFSRPCFRLSIQPGISLLKIAFAGARIWLTDSKGQTLTAILRWGPRGPKISTTVSEEFFSSGDCADGMSTRWK